MVINYIMALHGLWDIANRAVADLVNTTVQSQGVSFESAVKVLREQGEPLPDPFDEWNEQTPALPPLQLQGTVSGPINVGVAEIAADFAQNGPYVAQSWSQSAISLLITAHETCKEMGYNTTDPIWEFLRHCRNAAAHGNSFHFTKREPRRPATWRGREITKDLQGTILFATEQEDSPFLMPADPVLLLWDIEQQYPGLEA